MKSATGYDEGAVATGGIEVAEIDFYRRVAEI